MTTSSRAGGLVGTAIGMSLLEVMVSKGIITSQEAEERIDFAVLFLETIQGAETDPGEIEAFVEARTLLERARERYARRNP